jgi:hypothetical protein
MLTINGENVSPLNTADAPFTVNRAAGPNVLIPIALGLTVVMGIVSFMGYVNIPAYIIIAPPALLAAHVISFIRLRNAVHLALQMHTHDLKLQIAIEQSQEQHRVGHLSQERLDAITRHRD